ncbi:MAG: cell wall hydrolase [Oscillospiraceae bacterium]|jgi:N-acetylmuramoyl-L-alanine amidase|nr:cell wall hydrolase [Oscillospiraceae bacterium]
MKTIISKTLAALLLAASISAPAASAAATDDIALVAIRRPAPLSAAPGLGASRVTVLVSGFKSGVSPEPSAFFGEARDGFSYASVRDLASALGARTSRETDGSMRVFAPGLELTASAGDKYIVANGRYLYAPDGVSLTGDELYAPVRQIARAFGAQALWSDAFKTVLITPGGEPIAPAETAYSAEDVKWMSRIIYAEAGGESFEGMLAVGNVVMNRVRSEYHPDTVYGVIFDRRSGVQFTPAYSGAINNTPSELCVIAAKLALDGAEIVGGSLYFSAAPNCWAARHRDLYATIGGHDFYL